MKQVGPYCERTEQTRNIYIANNILFKDMLISI